MTTFCWLPPDSEPARVSGSPPRTSNSLSSVRARATIFEGDRNPRVENAGVLYSRRQRFSARSNSSTSPRRWRSSAMWETPALSVSRGPEFVTSLPATVILPAVGARSPMIASISSDWPLASMPARPTISPARTSIDRSLTAGSPRSSSAETPSKVRSGSPSVCSGLSTRRSTSRPTISPASERSVAPSVGTVSIILPRRRTVTRSAMSSTSLSLCEMNTTDVPCSVNRRSTTNRSCASCGVSTAVGSSRTSTFAPRNSARRISTRCWVPTPMSSTFASGSTARPNSARAPAPGRRPPCSPATGRTAARRRARGSRPRSSPARA